MNAQFPTWSFTQMFISDGQISKWTRVATCQTRNFTTFFGSHFYPPFIIVTMMLIHDLHYVCSITDVLLKDLGFDFYGCVFGAVLIYGHSVFLTWLLLFLESLISSNTSFLWLDIKSLEILRPNSAKSSTSSYIIVAWHSEFPTQKFIFIMLRNF